MYKDQQINKLADHFERTSNNNCKNIHLSTEEIIEDFTIPLSKKDDCIFHSYYENRIPSEQIKTSY
jgi:hypothetical protein